jgi:hypothetical protein
MNVQEQQNVVGCVIRRFQHFKAVFGQVCLGITSLSHSECPPLVRHYPFCWQNLIALALAGEYVEHLVSISNSQSRKVPVRENSLIERLRKEVRHATLSD